MSCPFPVSRFFCRHTHFDAGRAKFDFGQAESGPLDRGPCQIRPTLEAASKAAWTAAREAHVPAMSNGPMIYSRARVGVARWPSLLRTGFSITELLVVLAVIGVLTGLLLPALSRARFSSKVTLCLNQYRQWGIAAGVYATDDGKGRLPSYRLPTAQLSFIGPWIVAVEMVTSLAPYGVTVPM